MCHTFDRLGDPLRRAEHEQAGHGKDDDGDEDTPCHPLLQVSSPVVMRQHEVSAWENPLQDLSHSSSSSQTFVAPTSRGCVCICRIRERERNERALFGAGVNGSLNLVIIEQGIERNWGRGACRMIILEQRVLSWSRCRLERDAVRRSQETWVLFVASLSTPKSVPSRSDGRQDVSSCTVANPSPQCVSRTTARAYLPDSA